MEETQQPFSVDINPSLVPILYTDNVFMTTNADGVVLNIGQQVGNTDKVHVVARIGMSREHAKKLAENLSKLLALTEGTSQTKQGKN